MTSLNASSRASGRSMASQPQASGTFPFSSAPAAAGVLDFGNEDLAVRRAFARGLQSQVVSRPGALAMVNPFSKLRGAQACDESTEFLV